MLFFDTFAYYVALRCRLYHAAADYADDAAFSLALIRRFAMMLALLRY